MNNKKSFLGIVPARGGSKRLPRKNLLELSGMPLIAWTIGAGINSKYITELVVASDDEEISQVSKNLNVECIELPAELAGDDSTIFDAVKHIIERKAGFNYIVLLQPTSPLRTSIHIDKAIDLLLTRDANAVISVSKAEHNPLWMNSIPPDLSMSGFLSDSVINKKSQDLPIFYRLNGAIYICDTKIFLREKTFFIKENIYAYLMDRECSIDIDESIDLKFAEILKRNQDNDAES